MTTTTTAHERSLYLLPGLRSQPYPAPAPAPAPAMSLASRPAPYTEFEILTDTLGRLWNSLLHPRDRHGRFIRTFSRVSFYDKKRGKHQKTFHGDVLGFDRDTGDVRIRVTAVDPGYPNPHGLKEGSIVQVPQNQLETRLVKAKLRTGGKEANLDKPNRSQVLRTIDYLSHPDFNGKYANHVQTLKQALVDSQSTTSGTSARAIQSFREVAELLADEKANLAGVNPDPHGQGLIDRSSVPKAVLGEISTLDNAINGLATVRHRLGDKVLPFSGDRGQVVQNSPEERVTRAKAELERSAGGDYFDFRTNHLQHAAPVEGARVRDQVYQRETENVLPELVPALQQKIQQGLTRLAGIRRQAMVAPGDRYHLDRNGDAVFPGSVVMTTAGKQGGSTRPAARMLVTRVHTEKSGKKYVFVRHFDPEAYGSKGHHTYTAGSKSFQLADDAEQSEALLQLAGRAADAGKAGLADLMTAFSDDYVKEMMRSYASKDAKKLSRSGGFFDTLPIHERVRADANNEELRVGDWVSAPNGELGVITWMSATENMLRLQMPDSQPIQAVSPKRVKKMHDPQTSDTKDYVPTREQAAAAARQIGAESVAKVIEDPDSDQAAITQAMRTDEAFLAALPDVQAAFTERDQILARGEDPSPELKARIAPFNVLAPASAGQFRDPTTAEAPPSPPTEEGTTTPPGRPSNPNETISSDGKRTNTETKAEIPTATTTTTGEGEIIDPADLDETGVSARFYGELHKAAHAIPEGPTRAAALNHLREFSAAMQTRDMTAFRKAIDNMMSDRTGLYTAEHIPALRGSELQALLRRRLNGKHSGDPVNWPDYFKELEEHFPELFFKPRPDTTARPPTGADDGIPISVDITDDEISKSLLDGLPVFFNASNEQVTEGYAVQQKDSIASYPDTPTVEDVKSYIADHPFIDDDYLAVHVDPTDGGYRISKFSVFPATDEGRAGANSLAESTEVNQFIDISTGEVLNVSGPDTSAGDDPVPTDKSAERAIQPGDTPGTATVKKRTAKQTQVLNDLLNTDPDDATRAAIQAALDGTPLTAEQASALTDHIANLPDGALGGDTAQARSGARGVAAQLADRVARAAGSQEPRAYASRNTALRRSSDITSGMWRAMAPETDDEIAQLLDGARDAIKAGDYDAASAAFRSAADALTTNFPDQPQTARAVARAIEHADRLDRTTTGKGEQQAAHPETTAPGGGDEQAELDRKTAEIAAADANLTEDPTTATADDTLGTVWRGLTHAQLTKAFPGLMDDVENSLEPPGDVSEMGRYFEQGEKLLEALNSGDLGLGRHWTSRKAYADMIPAAGGYVVQAEYFPESIQTDPKDISYSYSEDEITMRPGARMRVTGIYGRDKGINLLREPVEVNPDASFEDPADGRFTLDEVSQYTGLKVGGTRTASQAESPAQAESAMRVHKLYKAGKYDEARSALAEEMAKHGDAVPERMRGATGARGGGAADLFADDGWDELPPEHQAALQRALDEALAENPDLDLQEFREDVLREGEEEEPPPPTGDIATQAAELFKDDDWDALDPDEQALIIRALTEALEEDPDLDLQGFRNDVLEEEEVTPDETEDEGPSGAPPPPAKGLKGGGLKKFAAAKAAEYALKDAADNKIESEAKPEGEDAGAGETTVPHTADPTTDEATDDLEDPTSETDAEAEAAEAGEGVESYPELDALSETITQLPDEKHAQTRQQKRIIAAIQTGKDVVVRALAGTGKTSTLVAFAKRMKEGQRAIYLAFNKSVQEEAAKRFPNHVESRTVNSMAWRAMGDAFSSRTEKGITAPTDIFNMLDMRRFSTSDGDTRGTGEMVDIVKSSLRAYMISGDDTLDLKHVDEGITDDKERAEVLGWAQAMWKDFTDPKGKFGFDQDALVKMWALRRPDFTQESSGIMTPLKKGDVILFDEAQDINDVLARVVRDNQLQTITVGDGHQSIYGWRGATDQLDKMNAHYDLPLTESWRFGNGVASWGNRALQGLGSKYRVIGRGPESKIYAPNTMTDMDAILTRTNRGAMQAAIQMIEEGKSVGVSKKTRHYLDQIVSTVGWLRDGQAKPKFDGQILNELRPYLSKGAGRSKVWLSPEDAWDAIVTAGTRERNPDTNVRRVLGIADKFSSDELQHILNNVKVVINDKGERAVDTTPDLLTDHNAFHKDNPLNLGDELNVHFSPDGKKLTFGGSTFRNKENIKGGQYAGKYVKWNSVDKKWEIPIGDLNNAAYRQRLSDDMNALMNRIIPKIDVVISTAHLSKGLEWDKVRIWNDFKRKVNPDTGLPQEPTPEEKRLAYVALTRAIEGLDPGSLDWVLQYSKPEEGEAIDVNAFPNEPTPPPPPGAPTAPTSITPDDIGGMDVPTMIEGIPGTKFDYTKVLSEFISGDKKSIWDSLTRAEKRAAARKIVSATETGGARHPTTANEFLLKHTSGDLKRDAARWADADADWDPNEQRYLDADKAAGEGGAPTATPFTPTKGGLEGMAEIGNFYDKNRDIPSAESIAGVEAARGVIGWVTSNRAEAYFANWARRDASAGDMRALFDRVLADPDFQGTTGSTWDILAKYHKEGTLPGAPEGGGGGGGTSTTTPGGGEGGGGAAADAAAVLQRFRDSNQPLTDEQAKRFVLDAIVKPPQDFKVLRTRPPATVDEFATMAGYVANLTEVLDRTNTLDGSAALSVLQRPLDAFERAQMVKATNEFLDGLHKTIRDPSDALPENVTRPIMEALKERLDKIHSGSAVDTSPVDKAKAMGARERLRQTTRDLATPEQIADTIRAAVEVLDSELREPQSADLSDAPAAIAKQMGSLIDTVLTHAMKINHGRLHPTVLEALTDSGALSRGLIGQSAPTNGRGMDMHDYVALQQSGAPEGFSNPPRSVIRTVTWSDDSTTLDPTHIKDDRPELDPEKSGDPLGTLEFRREVSGKSFNKGVELITPNGARFLNNTFKDVGGIVARTDKSITEGESPLAKWSQQEIAEGRTGRREGSSDTRTHGETAAAFLKGINSIVVSDYALSYTADEKADWYGHVVPHELGHAMDSMVGEMLGPGSQFLSKVDPDFLRMYDNIFHAATEGVAPNESLLDWYFRNDDLGADRHNGKGGTTEMFAEGYAAYAAALMQAHDKGVDLNSDGAAGRNSRETIFRKMGGTILTATPTSTKKRWDKARLEVGEHLFAYFDNFEKNVLPGMWADGPLTVVHATHGDNAPEHVHGARPAATAAPSTTPPANVAAQLKSIKRRDGSTLEFAKAPDRGTPEWDAWATQLKATHPTVALPGPTYVQLVYNQDALTDAKQGVVWRGWQVGKTQSQTAYSEHHKETSLAQKHQRGTLVDKQVPAIIAKAKEGAAKGDPVAIMALMIASTGMRVSSSDNAGTIDRKTGKKIPTYGASSLMKKHVFFPSAGMVRFKFLGKSGKENTYESRDPELIAAMRGLVEGKTGTQQIYPKTNSTHSINFFREASGMDDILNHDLRTWFATDLARREIAKTPKSRIPKTPEAFKKERARIAKIVGDAINDGPAVADKNYIAPSVWLDWQISAGVPPDIDEPEDLGEGVVTAENILLAAVPPTDDENVADKEDPTLLPPELFSPEAIAERAEWYASFMWPGEPKIAPPVDEDEEE